MEIVKYEVKVYGNIVEIIPKEGFEDNSIYEIRLKNVESEKGDTLDETIKLCTKLSPVFVDIQAVKSIVENIDIPDDVILYHIREASRFAEYIQGKPIDENNVPFEVTQFVKYKAAHECLLRHMINLSSSTGTSGTVGSVTFAEKETSKDISRLLDHICKEVAKWTDDVKGFKMEGRAKMKSAIKSSSYVPYNTIAPTPAYSKLNIGIERGI